VFISHAGEQKFGVVELMVPRLSSSFTVFADAWTLQAAEDACQAMIRACGTARVGAHRPLDCPSRSFACSCPARGTAPVHPLLV